MLRGIGTLITCVAAGAVSLVLLAPAAAAEEKPFAIEFDQSSIQIGPLADLPLGAISSGASIEGTIDGNGKVTIPKGKFRMPVLGIEDPVRIQGFMGIEETATGTFDEATGRLVIETKAGIWISVNVSQLLTALEGLGLDLSDQLGGLGPLVGLLGNLTCGFAPMDVTFTTESTSLASGQPFAKGPLGPGAITGEWSQLGPFAGQTPLPIDACLLLREFLPGLLGGLLGAGLPGGIDLGGIDIAGLLNNLDDVNLGPSGLTLIRTVDESGPSKGGPPDSGPHTRPAPSLRPAQLRVRVAPRRRSLRPGRAATFRVQVRNTGERRAGGARVCLRRPRAIAVGGNACRRLGALAPGASKVRRFRVRARKSARKRAYRPAFVAAARGAKRARVRSLVRVR